MKGAVELRRDGAVATVTIAQPARRNAITYEMWRQLAQLGPELDRDTTIRAVVVRGAGREAFSAGADIAEFETRRQASTAAQEYAAAYEWAMDALAAIDKPTLALIHGVCAGGGLELACALDLRYAADAARLGVPAARLGVVVGHAEMQRLVAVVGAATTLDLLLTARLLDAHEAKAVGLLTAVLPAEELDTFVQQLAERLAELAPLSHRAHKRILRAVLQNTVGDPLTREQHQDMFACFDSEDYREGRRAFLEKRPPRFEGR